MAGRRPSVRGGPCSRAHGRDRSASCGNDQVPPDHGHSLSFARRAARARRVRLFSVGATHRRCDHELRLKNARCLPAVLWKPQNRDSYDDADDPRFSVASATSNGTVATVASRAGRASRVLAQSKGSPFVLVHGAWHGGWCWRRVADRLTAKGRYVVAPTLSGVGERSHLANDSINLSTHIDDVVNEIKWKDLEALVLVGHSYGGMVITGVAERMRERIAAIVYLDAFLPQDGQSLSAIRGSNPLRGPIAWCRRFQRPLFASTRRMPPG